jgi:transcriptional regulator with XRE-family HTH domain
MGIGERIRQKRKEKRMTQAELGSAVNVSSQVISNWERGYSDPSHIDVAQLAEILDCSTEFLHGRKIESALPKNTGKDEKDIAKRMEEIRMDLTRQDGLSFDGEPMSEEAIESLMEAMEHVVRQTQRINKKYIPKKHRKDDNQ